MRFSNVLKGTRAERSLEIPGFETDGKPFVVLARPLTGLEYESACASARVRAVEKGVENPVIGDPIYDLALMAHILAVGCVDPDSPPDARTPSFDSAAQILERMNPETIVFVHQNHEVWQDECSPSVHKIEDNEMYNKVSEVAGADGRATFMRFSPSTRVTFSLSMARTLRELWASLEAKSSLTSASEEDTRTDERLEPSESSTLPKKTDPSD